MKVKHPNPAALPEETFLQQFPHHEKHAEVDEHRPEWWELKRPAAPQGSPALPPLPPALRP